MSLYYNKKLISGVRDVPSMTLAQYNALTNKPKLWIRTDAPSGDRGINADDIQYDSNTSVKEKIDENKFRFSSLLYQTSTYSAEDTNIDISGYDAICLELAYYGNPFASVIYHNLSDTNRVYGFVDSVSNFASGYAHCNSSFTIIDKVGVTNGVGNAPATRVRIYGVNF